MATTDRSTVISVFQERKQAERANDELRRAGFPDESIGLAMRGGDVTAGSTGPGGTGPTATGQAATRKAASGPLSMLRGLDVPEEQAGYYEREFQAGRIIMTVRGSDRASEAAALLRRFGGHEVEMLGAEDPLGAMRAAGRTVRASGAPEVGTHPWDEVAPSYRREWQRRHGSADRRWEEVEPGYRFGYEMAGEPRYRGRSWAEVEPELRRGWSERHRNRPWDQAAEAIRDAWESTTGGIDRAAGGARTVELREEELVAHKDLREVGEVTIRTELEEFPGRLEVEAYREEVEVEHVPVGQVVNERVPPWEEDGVMVVPVYEEQLVVVKRLMLREHLRIRRVATTERQLFEETLRRERLVVEDPGQTGLVHDRHPTDEELRERYPGHERADLPEGARERGEDESDEPGFLERLGRKVLQ